MTEDKNCYKTKHLIRKTKPVLENKKFSIKTPFQFCILATNGQLGIKI